MVADLVGELLREAQAVIPNWIKWHIEIHPGQLGVTPEVESVKLLCSVEVRTAEAVVTADELEPLAGLRNRDVARRMIDNCRQQLGL